MGHVLTPKDDPFNARANYHKSTELFTFRLEREGRLIEFREACRKKEAQGVSRAIAERDTRRTYGYLGVFGEREHYANHLRVARTVDDRAKKNLEQKITYANRKYKNIEEALAGLPSKADPHEEIEWVRAHPMMGRHASFTKKLDQSIALKVEDVNEAPHGPCPSRTAWNMLTYWVDNQSKFHEKLLDEHKKIIKSNKEVLEEAANQQSATEKDINSLLDSLGPAVEVPPEAALPEPEAAA
jgi:hypothetical protein